MAEMNKVTVIGAGTMGTGIAQAIASSGFNVTVNDIDQAMLDQCLTTIEKRLNSLVKKQKIEEKKVPEILKNISVSVNLKDALAGSWLVIEAASENMNVKKKIFENISKAAEPDTIFATNTSALSITELATSTDRAKNFIGVHFFNPAHVMDLVEVIKGSGTDKEVVDKMMGFATACGKKPVLISEAPGFVVNRILVPMINEASFALMEGVASAEDIDQAMVSGANHPIGPLALGDLIGLDVCLSIMETLFFEYGDSKYRPCPLLRKMVRAGKLGRKTKEGFFTY